MKPSQVIYCLFCLALVSLTTFANPLLTFDTVRMFDQYGNISWKHEKERLDNVALQLRDEPNAVAYIIAYGGKRPCIGEAQARAQRAKTYLVNVRGVNFNRVIWKDGGYRQDLTVEIYIFPREASEPLASPTFMSSDVQTRKCNRNRRGRS